MLRSNKKRPVLYEQLPHAWAVALHIKPQFQPLHGFVPVVAWGARVGSERLSPISPSKFLHLLRTDFPKHESDVSDVAYILKRQWSFRCSGGLICIIDFFAIYIPPICQATSAQYCVQHTFLEATVESSHCLCNMAPTRIISVALAGATGNLGGPVLDALLEHFTVRVLSRVGGNSSKLKPHPRLTIHEVDFSSAESIAPVLAASSVEVVVSCLATIAIGGQNQLIDASVMAGVKCFIPAEFGMDSLEPLCAQLPVCEPKVATQKYLQEKSLANPSFSYTGIANGLFLDWGIKEGFIIDVAHHTATLYNGGNTPFSATTLGDVAAAVVAVAYNHSQAETANRILYVHSTVTTQNQLIQYARDADGKAWKVTHKVTEEVMRESMELLREGSDMMGAMNGFCALASWTPAYGCDFSGHLDNALLGIEPMDEPDVRALVSDLLK